MGPTSATDMLATVPGGQINRTIYHPQLSNRPTENTCQQRRLPHPNSGIFLRGERRQANPLPILFLEQRIHPVLFHDFISRVISCVAAVVAVHATQYTTRCPSTQWSFQISSWTSAHLADAQYGLSGIISRLVSISICASLGSFTSMSGLSCGDVE